MYHGPRHYHVSNSQRSNSCNCKLAAKTLEAILYVIVIDAFVPREEEAHVKLGFLDNLLRLSDIFSFTTGKPSPACNHYFSSSPLRGIQKTVSCSLLRDILTTGCWGRKMASSPNEPSR